ncbi:hypothetical protein [Flavicella sediminum]|uniref:hypothetical protein n=1 Tax=Flavicella sediminum TaxID=2585141 RepID=UPI00111D46D2|nr:hypothetical protein [Flavicella sediminum]
MKKVILSAVLMVLTVTMAMAQPKQHGSKKMDFTPEQKSRLAVKKLTLALDLSTSQQQKLKPLIMEGIQKREAVMAEHKANRSQKKQLSSDEAYVKMNKMLDEKIAAQKKIKSILNKDQFEKWLKMKSHREGRKGHGKMSEKGKGPQGEKGKKSRKHKQAA